ncbi:MAG: zf-HC2 domain-containing protein, partial [Planctomycetota bacterium]
MSAPHPDDDFLILLAEGEMPGEDAAALEAHVRECPACRARLERWRGRADWLKARCAGFREPPPLALPGGNVLRLGIPRLFRVAAAILLAAASSGSCFPRDPSRGW